MLTTAGMTRAHKVILVAITLALVLVISPHAMALSMIRDAEIESTLRRYSEPLLQAAGLNPASVAIYIVKDKNFNAFVAGGSNLFIHTGLLRKTDHASQVIGVIAHETGHIVGGHLMRMGDELRRARITALLTSLLGLGTAVASGRADVAMAVAGGGMQVASRVFFAFTRTQESAADQAAFRLLDATRQSTRGYLESLEKTHWHSSLLTSSQDLYTRTHPLTEDRLRSARSHIKRSPYSDKPTPPAFDIMHARMKAKLDGFLAHPSTTLKRRRADSPDFADRYARAIALYRLGQIDEAIRLVDILITEEPENAYLHELKGQILFENSRIAEALPSYRQAAYYAPKQALILTEFARVLIEEGSSDSLVHAAKKLEDAILIDPDQAARAWFHLSVARGRLGSYGEASLALAEHYSMIGDSGRAIQQARRAQNQLPKNSSSWQRAQDILALANGEKGEAQE